MLKNTKIGHGSFIKNHFGFSKNVLFYAGVYTGLGYTTATHFII